MIFLMKIPLALTSQLSDPHLLHAKTVPLLVSPDRMLISILLKIPLQSCWSFNLLKTLTWRNNFI